MRFRGLEPQPCLNHKSSPRVRKGEKEDTDFRLLSKRSGGARRGGLGGWMMVQFQSRCPKLETNRRKGARDQWMSGLTPVSANLQGIWEERRGESQLQAASQSSWGLVFRACLCCGLWGVCGTRLRVRSCMTSFRDSPPTCTRLHGSLRKMKTGHENTALLLRLGAAEESRSDVRCHLVKRGQRWWCWQW